MDKIEFKKRTKSFAINVAKFCNALPHQKSCGTTLIKLFEVLLPLVLTTGPLVVQNQKPIL